ncbi:MAG TPA: hypothetical protein VFP61_04930 [Acidimicrobiales bacterium]|nr:hypothetical protein [Acidimicrobiales bacterium]
MPRRLVGGSGAAQGTVVKAALTEYRITLSPTPAAPGLYTFVATNRGAAVHALEVVGPGGTQRTPDLGAGQSARFTVRLASGSTDVFCPVGTHKELGMDLELTIP